MPMSARNPIAQVQGPFDYADKTHYAMYEKNIESIYQGDKKSERYDLEQEGLQAFMALLDVRVKCCLWTPLVTYVVNGVPLSMMDHFGEIPESLVLAKALVYLAIGSRDSQDSEQLYQCLLNSITTSAFNRLTNIKERFMVSVPIAGALVVLSDGPLL